MRVPTLPPAKPPRLFRDSVKGTAGGFPVPPPGDDFVPTVDPQAVLDSPETRDGIARHGHGFVDLVTSDLLRGAFAGRIRLKDDDLGWVHGAEALRTELLAAPPPQAGALGDAAPPAGDPLRVPPIPRPLPKAPWADLYTPDLAREVDAILLHRAVEAGGDMLVIGHDGSPLKVPPPGEPWPPGPLQTETEAFLDSLDPNPAPPPASLGSGTGAAADPAQDFAPTVNDLIPLPTRFRPPAPAVAVAPATAAAAAGSAGTAAGAALPVSFITPPSSIGRKTTAAPVRSISPGRR